MVRERRRPINSSNGLSHPAHQGVGKKDSLRAKLILKNIPPPHSSTRVVVDDDDDDDLPKKTRCSTEDCRRIIASVWLRMPALPCFGSRFSIDPKKLPSEGVVWVWVRTSHPEVNSQRSSVLSDQRPAGTASRLLEATPSLSVRVVWKAALEGESSF